jgi:hypothetical protein
MQRRYLLMGGTAVLLALLLLAAGIAAFVLPSHDTGPGPGPLPPQPTSVAHGPLKAEPGDTVVTLSWEPVAGAASYFIYRDGSNVPLNPTAIAETRYTDIGLSNGRTYTYTVGILNAAGKPSANLPQIAVAPKSR